MLLSTGSFFGGTGTPAAPNQVTYLGTQTLGTAHSTQTFAVNIGAAAADALIVACVENMRNAAAQRTISTVSFDGTNGTIHVQTGANDGFNQGIQVGVASRLVTVGGTINVIPTFSGITAASAVHVFKVTGLLSTTPTDTVSGTGNDVSTSTLDNNDNGVIIGSFSGADGTLGPLTLTGVGHTEADQSIVASPSGFDFRVAAGWSQFLAALSNRTVAVSSSANLEALAAVSWS